MGSSPFVTGVGFIVQLIGVVADAAAIQQDDSMIQEQNHLNTIFFMINRIRE